VSRAGNQFSYDANGNITSDVLNKNTYIKYDHRNLILELTNTKYILNDSLIILTKYYYDESGNRIRKMSYNTRNDSLVNDVIYSRDVSGRELAIYKNGSIDQWNIYGMDNIGFIDGNEDIRFYMKDHLGSVRAVTDVSGNVVSSQDYDAWGYLLENRVYESDESIFKFTSKERDDESKYDYFGARYYDARIGRWGGIDPFLEEHFDFNPYQYTLNSPTNFLDPDGKSTHTDRNGNVLNVYDDNDLNVYRHDVDKDYSGPFKGGEVMGETEYWDEFINPDNGKIKSKIEFERSWDDIIEGYHEISLSMDLRDIAENSTPNQLFDIKTNKVFAPNGPMSGRLLNGKYVTARSAGNFLAGYNAAHGTYFGTSISFDTFMKLAGALHTENYNKVNAAKIIILGESYGPAPWYGEIEYTGRMSRAGWNK